MRPPRNLNELDPKEFPLAAVPTPSNLKRFCFDMNGKPTHFREMDDPGESLREVKISAFLFYCFGPLAICFANEDVGFSWTCLCTTSTKTMACSGKLFEERNAYKLKTL
jgi:hypothetical protein